MRTPALDANARWAEHGLDYWSPGPLTGTFWALEPDGEPVVVDRDGARITREQPGFTTGQVRVAERGSELAEALRAGATPMYGRGGHEAIGLTLPAPEHVHHTTSGACDGQCRLLIPFDRKEATRLERVMTYSWDRTPHAA